MTTYCCSSGTNVMRGSSIPQISSGYSLGLGINVGSRSICQPSTPFRERAAHRWDKPRRSSMRHSSRVVPSCSRVAPAGQSSLCAVLLWRWDLRLESCTTDGSMRASLNRPRTLLWFRPRRKMQRQVRLQLTPRARPNASPRHPVRRRNETYKQHPEHPASSFAST